MFSREFKNTIRKSNPLAKKHRYETQADLQQFTAEQILEIDPKDIGTYIEVQTGDKPLTGEKMRALYRLLAYKKIPSLNKENREKLNSNVSYTKTNPKSEANELLKNIAKEVQAEHFGEDSTRNLEDRLNRLKGLPVAPLTAKEQAAKEGAAYFNTTEIGGRTKRKRRRKSPKRRKTQKRKRHTKKRY